ncbi:BPSS1187 family protein [Humibacter soli]
MRWPIRLWVIAAVALIAAVAALLTVAPTAAATASTGPVRYRLHPDVPTPNPADVIERPAHGYAHGPLLLFLPATRALPSDYLAFADTATHVGYHVLSLAYYNSGRSIARTCGVDAACYTSVQTNRLDGGAPSRFSRVGDEGGILPRFAAAIHAAAARDPHGHWSRYLSHHGPVWNDIVVAGHSQGGGEAAFIAHLHRVRGVLMFSSPVDDDRGVIPTWMHTVGATPASRMYAFDAANDMYVNRIVGSWRALGIRSPIDFGSPVAGAHLLMTHYPLGTPVQAHGRTVTDASPGAAAGHPVFEARWTWMLRRTFSPAPPTTVSAQPTEGTRTGRT